jgi:hypothetical protein
VIGPFRPAAFFTAYTFIAVPNAVAATAIQFAAAARTGRPMTGYLGSFLLFLCVRNKFQRAVQKRTRGRLAIDAKNSCCYFCVLEKSSTPFIFYFG